MSAKKKPVSTPLHLLQQLTGSLLEHFEQACTQALTDAEKILAKLEKQRVKAQDKLHKHKAKIESAASAGKAKAQAKARANAEALEGSLNELQKRQGETRQYIGELKNDIQAGLALAQGVGKVREAVAKALDQRKNRQTAEEVARPSRTVTAKAPAAKAQAATPKAVQSAKAGASRPVAPSKRPAAARTRPAGASPAAPAPKAAPRKAPVRASSSTAATPGATPPATLKAPAVPRKPRPGAKAPAGEAAPLTSAAVNGIAPETTS